MLAQESDFSFEILHQTKSAPATQWIENKIRSTFSSNTYYKGSKYQPGELLLWKPRWL